MQHFTRRNVIKSALAFYALNVTPRLAFASLPDASRSLHFHNIHTGESFKAVYWEEGNYLPETLKDIAYILRDHRTGDMLPIDTHLLDVLAELHQRLRSNKPFEVISGYRSPRTNAILHEHSHGVAKNSLHMAGKAIDIRVSDRSLSSVRNAAWAMQQGGVGYYPADGFVHVDVGDVHRW